MMIDLTFCKSILQETVVEYNARIKGLSKEMICGMWCVVLDDHQTIKTSSTVQCRLTYTSSLISPGMTSCSFTRRGGRSCSYSSKSKVNEFSFSQSISRGGPCVVDGETPKIIACSWNSIVEKETLRSLEAKTSLSLLLLIILARCIRMDIMEGGCIDFCLI